MTRPFRSIFGVSVLAMELAVHAAGAQTTGTSGTTTTTTAANAELVTPTNQVQPERIDINNNDLGISTRAANLTPLGINYDDCISDQRLEFKVILSGFAAADLASMQIWATREGDCTGTASRGIQAIPTCWPLGQGTSAAFVSTTPQTLSFVLRVQDIVGPQNAPTSSYVRQGASACTAQPTFAAVPITIWFLPLDSTGNLLGTAYSYPLSTDMVGPPPPTGLSESVGDTLFVVNWTPNVDADTAGYDVYIDPIPGQSPDAGTSSADATNYTLVCDDGGTSGATTGATTSGATTGDTSGAATGDTSDAMTEAASDATTGATSGATTGAASGSTSGTATSGACHIVPIIPTAPSGGACSSTVLTGAISIGTASSTTTDTEAGTDTESGTTTTTTTGVGGISTIPSNHLVGINQGLTASDRTSGTYTITGLTNLQTYTVVVSAVDAFGNIGPPSTQTCDYPAPVDDFWKKYRDAGGQAGGGYCALQAVGTPVGSSLAVVGLGTALFAFVQRRRRRV